MYGVFVYSCVETHTFEASIRPLYVCVLVKMGATKYLNHDGCDTSEFCGVKCILRFTCIDGFPQSVVVQSIVYCVCILFLFDCEEFEKVSD